MPRTNASDSDPKPTPDMAIDFTMRTFVRDSACPGTSRASTLPAAGILAAGLRKSGSRSRATATLPHRLGELLFRFTFSARELLFAPDHPTHRVGVGQHRQGVLDRFEILDSE
jgi:hypothetical protein